MNIVLKSGKAGQSHTLYFCNTHKDSLVCGTFLKLHYPMCAKKTPAQSEIFNYGCLTINRAETHHVN